MSQSHRCAIQAQKHCRSGATTDSTPLEWCPVEPGGKVIPQTPQRWNHQQAIPVQESHRHRTEPRGKGAEIHNHSKNDIALMIWHNWSEPIRPKMAENSPGTLNPHYRKATNTSAYVKWHSHRCHDSSRPTVNGQKVGSGPIPENPCPFAKIVEINPTH